MTIGVDLDNTIICYDRVLAGVADTLPPAFRGARGKRAVKQAVEGAYGPDAWTELQAEIYGPRLAAAQSFPGAREFFIACRERGIAIRIISHKTVFPARGPRHDLRQAARTWLESHGWFDPSGAGLSAADVEFHDTQEAKLAAIASHRCTTFIDDLPEIFLAAGFPRQTRGLLFDPEGAHPHVVGVQGVRSWREIHAALLEAAA